MAKRGVEGRKISDERVAATFATSDAFALWREDPARVAVVQVDTGSNLAVGGVALGPASIGVGTTVGLGITVGLDVGIGWEVSLVAPDAKVAVVARALSLNHPAQRVLADLLAAGHHTILVECGWPRTPADVETYGGSPAVARALVGLLGVEAPR